MAYLSPNFTEEEFIYSDTAKKYGINNSMTEFYKKIAIHTCTYLLEPLRTLLNQHYGCKVIICINSGYRGPSLNAKVGGVSTSQHCKAEAADLTCYKVINKVEDAMKEKPFGIDSAFNVASPEEMPRGEHVYVEKEKDPEVVNQEMVDKVRKEKKEKLEAEEKAYNERISKYDASEAETEVLTQESQQSVLQKMQAIRYEDAMDQYLTGGGQYPDPSEADQDESDEDEDNTSFFRKKKKNRKRNKKNKKDNKSSDNNQNADKQKKQQSDQQSVQNDINNTQANQEAEKTKVVLPGAGDEEE